MSCYYFVPVNVVLGKKEYIYRQQLLKDILYNPELFLVWSITIFVVLNVKVLGVSRFDQSFGIYKCQKLICRNCRGQPSDCFEEEGKSLLFSSILKRRQSEVSQHVGDTSRGVVFVTSFGSWSELHISGCFLACQCHFAGMVPDSSAVF